MSKTRPLLAAFIPLVPLVSLTFASPALRAQEAAPAADAPPPPPAASPDVLQRLDAVEQEARIANRKLELLDEAAAAKKKEAPAVYVDEKGFDLASADKAFVLSFHALLQLDARRHMDTSDA